MKESKFAKEFKSFISRGNVVDMAVGVVIGGAFTAIITSLVNDVIMPIIGMVTGGINFSELKATVGSAELCYGNFIQAIVNFLLVALVLFCVIKSLNKMKKKEEEKPAEPPKPAEDIVLLTEIRDLLKK
ncbi:MAG: large-conductance mechanosensitive channel protein MscL [Firmicutes bacterium]|nr:large-conductance mechanosensitive channel protein MscL [Bacillota bacterium]MBQ1525102.1 large-conductance mechanosensitive channel protein MscL [Bacillota bacterium]MBQ3579351.1 large-conductance mechanosensitive channel protein MscL [Bacillota bacterium]MBQ4233948.1 large-conductance mechanosensitive channel protein MscL [Bacillota bacterium]MBQ5437915.1 large-conductance mechanosensitive channel protein MscL [Bacillota bacterium]